MKIFEEMRSEVRVFAEALKRANPRLAASLEEDPERNPLASMMAFYLQDWERRVLQVVFRTFCDRDLVPRRGSR